LARKTQYTTMISGPSYVTNDLKLIQLSRLDSSHLIAVIVLEGNVIRNKMIDVAPGIEFTDKDLLQLNVLLNSALQGKTLDDLTISFMRSLKNQAGEFGPVIAGVLNAVVEAVEESSGEAPEIYTSGATNIFRYPELTDGDTAREFLTSLEDKDKISGFLSESRSGPEGIHVYIGNETRLPGMQNCSVVTASYELGKGVTGTIGIVGPKRMDYDHVIGTLKTLMEQLNDLYQK
ncbi:MAG: HrcA family transcriptional regulator, partial [Lachnospiraceae bacterium]|nr:HrcA family transcriptional regulator [Lachnospiraceae bacterium]